MFNDSLFYLFSSPWELHAKNTNSINNKYVCISGNSGVGKSTLLRSLGEAIFKEDNKTIAVDEKHIHHPFLPSLFLDTKKYGFQIQLNFMIQRALLINKCLDAGYNLVMERSHFDDRVFMTSLYNLGEINKSEYDTYMQLWNHLLKRTYIPDVMILIDYPVDSAIANITADEISGRRPKEFPDEKTKKSWLAAWHDLYTDFFDEMRNNHHDIKIVEYKGNMDCENIISQVKNLLGFNTVKNFSNINSKMQFENKQNTEQAIDCQDSLF